MPVDDQVVPGARVVLLDLDLPAAGGHDRRSAGGEHVLPLVAAPAAEAGAELAEVVRAAHRELVAQELERARVGSGHLARPRAVGAHAGGAHRGGAERVAARAQDAAPDHPVPAQRLALLGGDRADVPAPQHRLVALAHELDRDVGRSLAVHDVRDRPPAPRVEERAPGMGLDLDAGRSARGSERGRQRDRQRLPAGRRLEAVAVGHDQRPGRRREREPDVDPRRGARQRSGRDVVGAALGAEEDHLVGAPQRAPAQPQRRAGGRRRAVVAAPQARPAHQLGRGAHDDPGRRRRGGRGARRAIRGGRPGRRGRATGVLGPRGRGSERQRDAGGVCDCAPASSRGHPPMGHALLLDRRPAGLADGLARPHALPGGNAWIRPQTFGSPVPPVPGGFGRLCGGTARSICMRTGRGVVTITCPKEGGGMAGYDGS